MNAKVRATRKFEGIRDAERDLMPKAGDEWITTMERAEYLSSKGVVEILEEIDTGKKKTEDIEKPVKKPRIRRSTKK